jgi:hypothetical protein
VGKRCSGFVPESNRGPLPDSASESGYSRREYRTTRPTKRPCLSLMPRETRPEAVASLHLYFKMLRDPVECLSLRILCGITYRSSCRLTCDRSVYLYLLAAVIEGVFESEVVSVSSGQAGRAWPSLAEYLSGIENHRQIPMCVLTHAYESHTLIEDVYLRRPHGMPRSPKVCDRERA